MHNPNKEKTQKKMTSHNVGPILIMWGTTASAM